MNSTLAVLGGSPVRKDPFPRYVTIGEEEKAAVNKVLDSGTLSAFYGSNAKEFFGGTNVLKLEKAWSKAFNVKESVAVNSATSGLYAAIGAIGVAPGDEVIVTPWTMSASASAILVYNAIPVFADISPDDYCIDPEDIERKITEKTKAIVVVHIFGYPAQMDKIMDIAQKYNLKVIEDCAQAPGAEFNGKKVGAIGDIGVFSLNCHKTIQCGEGGVVTTNDDILSKRLRLIRNHAEAVIADGMEVDSLNNMLGWNYRMTEIEAAIAYCQLQKLEDLNAKRVDYCNRLSEFLAQYDCFITPKDNPERNHVFYVYPGQYLEKEGVDCKSFVRAVNAEGLPLGQGYVPPLYKSPLYQESTLYGGTKFPFDYNRSTPYSYKSLCCRNLEEIRTRFFSTEIITASLTEKDFNDILSIFEKVMNNLTSLRNQVI